jgi:hypothetical protein
MYSLRNLVKISHRPQVHLRFLTGTCTDSVSVDIIVSTGAAELVSCSIIEDVVVVMMCSVVVGMACSVVVMMCSVVVGIGCSVTVEVSAGFSTATGAECPGEGTFAGTPPHPGKDA